MANFVRCLLGDLTGALVGEKEILPDEISWLLNDVGRLRFTVGLHDAGLHAGLLNFGRRVLLQFENGLPDWGGVIDPPRHWRDGGVEIRAYSGEYLLGWRYTGKSRWFSGSTPGRIFQALIEEGNALDPVGVEIGSVFTGGDSHSPDYHFAQVLRTVQDSVVGRLSGYDFDVTPALESGRIKFRANFYQRRGGLRSAALVQDKNLRSIALDEQGPIHNDVAIAGADTSGEGADGWGEGRITAAASDAASIGKYLRRQYGAVYSDVSVQTTLDGHAQRLVDERREPFNGWDLIAVDREPGFFRDYGIGDELRLQAPHYGVGGTDTTVRLTGRDYKPREGWCELVVREEA